MGAGAGVLASAQGGAVAADHRPPHRVEHGAGGGLAAGELGPALVAQHRRAASRAAHAGRQQRGDRVQLGPVHLGDQRRACDRSQPGVLHQPAAERLAGRAGVERAPAPHPVGSGGLCAAAGVLWLTIDAGAPPWIALGLAVSFGIYGLLRKLVAVDAVAGLGVESVYLFVPALLLAAWGEQGHGGAFLSGWSLRTDAMLIFGGVVTALPLIGFAYGVRRIPLSLVGILQYIAPSLQLLLGVWFFHEPFDQGRAIGFAAIWVGLLVFVGDSVVRSRQPVVRR
ncbi:hypothetical protein HZS92_04231 [Xanthomonas citri pv. citri]|uniref:EamA domain-containing protein n=1 Tax=Xanthomonas axonopodis pv. citri (strain 306) TaxID=190486 RepID=A0AAI7ZIN7_XANAC|nr:conserved hypothetical protein [Xanthomonas citri pv. citri str. 306]QYF37514.1 hypothetical protein HZS91_04291 [Xanthomonas citri pv. citri]QYF42087.1 hypothetical protein HZS92_04231 [Xanthomonas citri pv. citri]QYF46921.1 hypothetical protein HZS93_04291 [Xanthomonas citri]